MVLLKQGSRFLSKAICAAIVGFLSISCSDNAVDHQPKPEYGMPTARYKLDGIVVDAGTRNVVEGIRIRLSPHSEADTSEAVRTDADGVWKMDVRRIPCDPCSLRVEDVDGAEHGGPYEGLSVPIAPVRTEPPNGWFVGTFEQHLIEIEVSSAGGPGKGQH